MGDINSIAKQFVDFYYATFDSNRSQLSSLYVRAVLREENLLLGISTNMAALF
jgi:hypothetical protein